MATGAVVSPVTTFLQSEQALKILGLPGLALLLAFVFYRTLVSAKLVRPIGRNQSFAILLMIIGYFLIVSVLIIWVYRPERAAPTVAQQVEQRVEEPSTWSKIDTFFDRTNLDTPLSTFDSALGPPTADAPVSRDNSKLHKRTYSTLKEGVLVTVAHEGDSVRWIAAYDNSQKLRIPTMNMGEGQDDGSERDYLRLSDFDMAFLTSHCDEGKIEAPFAGRNGLYAVSPCYFGRPGGYNHYAFILEIGGGKAFSEDCGPMSLGNQESIADRVKRCHSEKERPFGFIVAADDALLPTAIEAFLDTLDH
jgi:hypothetical protein